VKISIMKKQRTRLILIGLLLLIAIWIAWPNPKPTKDQASTVTTEQSENPKKGIGWHLLGIGRDGNKNIPQNVQQNRPASASGSGMDRISRLITHQTLSNKEVAEQLRAIAADKRMPENIRTEALGHGVILDLPAFVDMAADSKLPPEMAQTLLQHVVNANGEPALQIRAYKEFLNHDSPEIRDAVKEVLAFILEDDEKKADDAALIEMADAKLKQIDEEASSQK
jgi:hypothetical protein